MRDDQIDTAAVRRGRRLLALSAAGTMLAVLTLGGGAGAQILPLLAWGAAALAGIAGAWAIARGSGIGPFCKNLGLFTLAVPLLNLLAVLAFSWAARSALERAARARRRARRKARRLARERVQVRAHPRAFPGGVPVPIAATSRIRQAIAYLQPAGSALGPSPVLRSWQGEFAIAYLVDEGDHFSCVSEEQLRAEGVGAQELHRAGLQNLLALIGAEPGLAVRPQGAIRVLQIGGMFEASLVLLDALWDGPLKAYVPNGAVVAVPARDVCAFCDARSAEGVRELHRLARRVVATRQHVLTESLFLRSEGRWRPWVAGQATASLPVGVRA